MNDNKFFKLTQAACNAYRAFKAQGNDHGTAMAMMRSCQTAGPRKRTKFVEKPSAELKYTPPEVPMFEPPESNYAQFVVGVLRIEPEASCKMLKIEPADGKLLVDIDDKMPSLKEKVAKSWQWMKDNGEKASAEIRERYYNLMVQYETDCYLFDGIMQGIRESQFMDDYTEEYYI